MSTPYDMMAGEGQAVRQAEGIIVTQWNDPTGERFDGGTAAGADASTWTAPGSTPQPAAGQGVAPDTPHPRPAHLPSPEPFPLGGGAPGGAYPGAAPGPVSPAPPGSQVREIWPGPIPLRPMDFGEIFEAAFRVPRYNPRPIFGLSAAVILSATILGLLIAFVLTASLGGLGPVEDGDLGALLSTSLPQLASILTGFAAFFLSGMLIVPVAEAALGRRIGPAETWARTKGRLLPLLGQAVLGALIGLALIVPGTALLIWGIAAEQSVPLFWSVLAFLVAAPFGVLVSVRFSLAPAAVVLEHLGPVTAMKRSWALTRGAFWRTLGIQFLMSLVVAAIGGALGAVLALLASAVGLGLSTGLGAESSGLLIFVTGALTTLLSAVAGVLTQPLSSAAIALVYLDRRFRTEALAVDLLAEAERIRAAGGR